jgi:hypothetical protein
MTNVRKPRCEECAKIIQPIGYKLATDRRVRWCKLCKPADAVPGNVSRVKQTADSAEPTSSAS